MEMGCTASTDVQVKSKNEETKKNNKAGEFCLPKQEYKGEMCDAAKAYNTGMCALMSAPMDSEQAGFHNMTD